jgi:outer membrane biosynthesis protein TonB
VQLLANEGDTVEPGNKIAIISRSADATTHVAPSENAHEKPAPKPTPKASEPEKKTPKVETEKPKAHTPPSSPSEPKLPPKDRESRVSHCDCYSFVSYVYQFFYFNVCLHFQGSYDKASEAGCYTIEGFPKHICYADNLQ